MYLRRVRGGPGAMLGRPIRPPIASLTPWRRWLNTLPYRIASHTTLQKPTLKEALEECLARLPAQPTPPALVALVLSKGAYEEQLKVPGALSALPPVPAVACLTDAIDDPFTRRLLGIPEDQRLTAATLTALYLPPGSTCCPFHTAADSVPKFRGYNDERLPLAKYMGAKGERLTFLVLTPYHLDAASDNPTLHLQQRLTNIFPNSEVTWLALHQSQFLVGADLHTEGASGVAIPSVDANCVAKFLLATFSTVPIFVPSMTMGLFTRLFLPSSNVTRPSGKVPSLHDTFWVGLYPFVVDDVQSHVPEVVHVQEVEGALTATKLTGDPFVPAGEVTWQTSATPVALNAVEPGRRQIAGYDFSHPAFVEAHVTVCNPDAIEVGFEWPMHVVAEGRETHLPKTLFARLTWDETSPPLTEDTVLPIFHVPGAFVLPEGVVYFAVSELRYQRMLRRALEDGSLIGVVDLRATQAKRSEWVIGTACRVIYSDFSDNDHTPMVVRAVGRFDIKAGGGTLSDFGLASARCLPRDDRSVTDAEATEGWALAEDIGRGLQYNPLASHLKTVPRTAATLSRVSFALANQVSNEKRPGPSKPGPDQVVKLAEFMRSMLQLQCPLERLKILASEGPRRTPI
jgi:hypothetical protein